MRIEIQGKIVEVDDSFASMSPDEQQAVVDEIASSLAPKEISKFEEMTGVSETSPLLGGAVGAILGIPAGAVIEGATKGAAAPLPNVAGTPGTGGEKWAKNWAGMNKPGTTVPEAAAAYQRTKGQGPVTSKVTQRFGPGAKLDIGSFSAEQEALEARQRAQKSQALAQRTKQALSGAASSIPKWLGRGVAGASIGAQGVDTANRFGEGDYLGGAISGLGTLGSGIAMIPHPLTRTIGTAVGAGAPLLNELIDRARKQPPPQMAGAGEAMPMAAGGIAKYAKGKAIKGGLESLKKFNLGDLEGKTIIGTMSDRTAVDLARGLYGGPLFPTIHKGAAWGVDSPGAASRILNAVQAAGGPDKAVVAPMLMSPTAHRSNRDVSKMALRKFQENYGQGKFGPERLSEIETSVRTIPGLSGLSSLMDPNAVSMLDKMTFGQRGAVVDRLGSKPVKAPALDLQTFLRETTEPGLEGTELGAIGPSLFRLSGERSIDPSLHGSYSHILHGEMLGGMNPIPREFVYRDLEAKAMRELGRPLSDYNYRTSVGIPSQFVDEKLLRSWEELGYMNPKTGGVNNPN
jgi:hypothetical protein